MYLSRIALNPHRRETMQALNSPNMLHGAIERSLDLDGQRKLWRVDWLGDTCYLLLLSAVPPDFAHIAEQFGYTREQRPWETKDYTPLLNRLRPGQAWRFRLRANPVHSSKENHESSSRGKVFAHVTQEQQKKWLLERTKACGFALNENEFDVVETHWSRFLKHTDGDHKVTLCTAAFEGVLTLTDCEYFKTALLTGIGRAKAYGCGLLTIAQLKDGRNE